MDTLIFGALGAFLAVVGVLYQTRSPLRVSRTTEVNKTHGVFSITVKNLGPGTATIKTMELQAYGVSTTGHTDDAFVTKMAQPIDMKGNPGIAFYLWEAGDTVGPGEELLVLEVKIPVENNDLDTTFKSLDQNVELRAKYRSVVGVPYSLVSKGK